MLQIAAALLHAPRLVHRARDRAEDAQRGPDQPERAGDAEFDARLPEGVELDDLISAGVFGLMDAIDAFDVNRGVKFETYCVPRIRGAILDEMGRCEGVPSPVRRR